MAEIAKLADRNPGIRSSQRVETDIGDGSRATGPGIIVPKRYEALDGLRGIAALGVVLFHIRWANHLTGLNGVRHTFLFVDLFFILSGFVLTTAYGEHIRNGAEFRKFIILRFFRIYPLHVAMLLCLVAMETLKSISVAIGIASPEHAPFSGGNSLATLPANIFLLQGLGFTGQLSWNTPSWSISCEALGYLLFGIAVLSGLIRLRIFPQLAIVVAAVSYGAVMYTNGTLDVSYDLGMLRCLAGFCTGIVVANFVQKDTHAFKLAQIGERSITIVTIGIVVWLGLALFLAHGYSEAIVLPAFALLVLFLHLDSGYVAKILRTAPIAFLGRISYSIYMAHVPILVVLLTLLRRVLGSGGDTVGPDRMKQLSVDVWIGDLLLVAVVVVVVIAASSTYYFIEVPGRELGRRIAGRQIESRIGRKGISSAP